MADRPSAAFYRVEGTLSSRPALAAAGWMALGASHLGRRVSRLGNVLAAAPLSLGGPFADQALASRVGWMSLRGMTEDRLAVLGQEYFDTFIKGNLTEVGTDLITQSRRRRQQIVLISEGIDVVMEPLRRHLEADFLVCNRLEMRAGRTTGRLLDPVVTGPVAARWAKGFATDHDINLEESCGYASAGPDSMLLDSLGYPCAVRPDRALRRIARDLDWPVVEG